MVAESSLGSLITEILPLGFGKCKLQVQVPLSSGIESPEGLVGKKVATSFEILAGEYYRELDEKKGQGQKTVIEYVGGSVEAACALGLADGIGTPFYSMIPLPNLR
jgi:ATP phosphoribosyltransferase